MRTHLNDGIVLALVVFQAVIAAAVLNPENLGLPSLALAWMAVANVGVGVLLNRLSTIGQKPE